MARRLPMPRESCELPCWDASHVHRFQCFCGFETRSARVIVSHRVWCETYWRVWDRVAGIANGTGR